MKKTNKKGFTLVELVVVVAVLLILAAIAIPTVMNLVNDAQDAAAAADAKSIETAIKYAHAQNLINSSGSETATTVADALRISGLKDDILETGFIWIIATETVEKGTAVSGTSLELDDETPISTLLS